MAGLHLFRFGGEDAITMGKHGWAAGRPLLLLGGDGVGGGGVKKTVSESVSWSCLAGDGDVIHIIGLGDDGDTSALSNSRFSEKIRDIGGGLFLPSFRLRPQCFFFQW